MGEAIEIVVHGHPEPGGSKTAIPLKRNGRYLHDSKGRPIFNVVDANDKKVRPWKKAVAQQAAITYGDELLEGPLIVEMTFYVQRPKAHYGTGRNARLLKDAAPTFPKVSPDLLKLARPVEDALSGVVWVDDCQTVDLMLRERYCDRYTGDECVVVRVLPHRFDTLGERARAAQPQLSIA